MRQVVSFSGRSIWGVVDSVRSPDPVLQVNLQSILRHSDLLDQGTIQGIGLADGQVLDFGQSRVLPLDLAGSPIPHGLALPTDIPSSARYPYRHLPLGAQLHRLF